MPTQLLVSVTPEERLTRAAERAWLHDQHQAVEYRSELLTLVVEQDRLARAGQPPPCACCGHRPHQNWRGLFRCYQCHLWLCPMCAGRHFPEVRR